MNGAPRKVVRFCCNARYDDPDPEESVPMQVFTVTKDSALLTQFEFSDNAHKFLHATQLIFIVPSNLVKDFERAYEARTFCTIIDEKSLLTEALPEIEKWNVSGFPERAGWYYQQLLKMAIATSKIAQSKYVVWDSDTIPYRNMTFFEGDKLIFTRGREFNKPYFLTNDALIGIDRSRENLRFSAISQHMPVDRELMLALLRRIGQDDQGDWVAAIRRSVSDGRMGLSLFSEYEIFADWVRVNYPDRFALRKLAWSRRGNLFSHRQLAVAKEGMHFIAFEVWDFGRRVSYWRAAKLWCEVLSALLQQRLGLQRPSS